MKITKSKIKGFKPLHSWRKKSLFKPLNFKEEVNLKSQIQNLKLSDS